MDIYTCSMCTFTSVAVDFLIVHIGHYHKNDPKLLIKCSLIGCGASFSTWATFERHVKNIHPDKTMVLQVANGMIERRILNGEDVENDVDLQLPTDNFHVFVAQFLINLRETYRTSQLAIDNVTIGLKDTLRLFGTMFLNEIREHRIAGTDTIRIDTIEQIYNLLSPSVLLKPVQSKYLLDKFLVAKLGMVPPQQIELGSEETWIRVNPPQCWDIAEKKVHAQHIPFLDTLRNLLMKEDIRQNIENPIIQEGETLKTVLHGSVFKNSAFFRQNPNALAIICNGDELGVANNLGGSSKKEKIYVFYWTLGNIHPNFRSIRDNIYLLAIAKSEHVKKFGMRKILQPFVDDIRTLQTEGITIVVDGRETNYKGTLLFSPCDHPAAAELGGFKQTVTAYRFCRSCMTTNDNNVQWQGSFNESAYSLRDAESHREHLAAVVGPDVTPAESEYWSREFGVNEESVLGDIENFDVTQCFPQDPMHVYLQGIVPMEIKALLSFLIYERNLFTLEDFNASVEHFDFDHFKVNKPAELKPDQLGRNDKIRLSASQIVSLAYALPFLIAPWITDDEEVLNAVDCHIRLIQILNYVFAYEIRESSTDQLERMIELFNLKFQELYPDWVVQKFHSSIHIPRYIRMFGPGRQQSCIRFEAAHQFFKSIVPVVKTFKNMPYTMSYRHQARLCSRLESAFDIDEKKFLYQGDEILFGEIVVVGNLHNSQLLLDNFEELVQLNLHIMRTRKVVRHGTTYQPQSVILLACSEDVLPSFAAIDEIFVIKTEIVIVYRKLQTLFYSETLNAYRIIPTSYEQQTVTLGNLIFPHPLPVLSCDEDKYVILLNYDHTEFMG